MTALFEKYGVYALAVILLLGIGAGLGAWITAGQYRPELDAANEQLATCKAARGNLETLTNQQNTALADLANQAEQRQAKAAQAVADAQQQADQHFAAAQRLQQESREGDPAQVAVDIIDEELGL